MRIGLDYGLGKTNINLKTGIRFGVIPANHVTYWIDDAGADYGHACCPACGKETDKDADEFDEIICEACDHHFKIEEAYEDSPLRYVFESGDTFANQSHDSGDIFITKSEFYTHAGFCSPCAPGACHLLSPDPEGEKCYCLGHDWYEEEAPYSVYRVSDDSVVDYLPSL